MDKKSVEAYAKAYCVLWRRLDHLSKTEPKPNSIALHAADINRAAMYPARGFTDAMTKALKFHAITDEDNDLIGQFINDVDDTDLQFDKPVNLELQGLWQQTYYKWRTIYTPAQAAETLGVTKQRISDLIKNGQLDYVKVGRRYYIPGYSVDRRVREVNS